MEIPEDLITWANSHSDIQWYLYNVNLLPEQINTEKQLCALRGFQFGWESHKKAEENKGKS